MATELHYWEEGYRYLTLWHKEAVFGPSDHLSDPYTCPCTEEGIGLVQQWKSTPCYLDGTISGVLADWLEENRGFLVGGCRESDADEKLTKTIDWLRSCFAGVRAPWQLYW